MATCRRGDFAVGAKLASPRRSEVLRAQSRRGEALRAHSRRGEVSNPRRGDAAPERLRSELDERSATKCPWGASPRRGDACEPIRTNRRNNLCHIAKKLKTITNTQET